MGLGKMFGFLHPRKKEEAETPPARDPDDVTYEVSVRTLAKVINENSALAIAEKMIRLGVNEEQQNARIQSLEARLDRLERQKNLLARGAALAALIIMFVIGISAAQLLRG